MQQKFFVKPFAVAGDRETVPDDIQTTGNVNYEQGYGYDYQRDQAIDPLAKPIERNKHNAILHDITEAVQQYQVFGTPEWITAEDNGGIAYPYARRARVRYRASETDPWEVYESLVDNNTAEPSEATKWAIVVSTVASSEQAVTGTDNNTIMTPLRIAQTLTQYTTQDWVSKNAVQTERDGTIYKLTTNNEKNAAWVTVGPNNLGRIWTDGDFDPGAFFKKDGSVAMTGGVNMSGQPIYNLPDPINGADAATVNWTYVNFQPKGCYTFADTKNTIGFGWVSGEVLTARIDGTYYGRVWTRSQFDPLTYGAIGCTGISGVNGNPGSIYAGSNVHMPNGTWLCTANHPLPSGGWICSYVRIA